MVEQMIQDKSYPVDVVFIEEVIICTKTRRGEGNSKQDPIRVITEIFTKDGLKIAEYDPYFESKK
jgi:hypothetical protein